MDHSQEYFRFIARQPLQILEESVESLQNLWKKETQVFYSVCWSYGQPFQVENHFWSFPKPFEQNFSENLTT